MQYYYYIAYYFFSATFITVFKAGVGLVFGYAYRCAISIWEFCLSIPLSVRLSVTAGTIVPYGCAYSQTNKLYSPSGRSIILMFVANATVLISLNDYTVDGKRRALNTVGA